MAAHLTEVNSTNTVPQTVQRGGPTHHTHDVGDHQHHSTRNSRFSRQAHLNKRNQQNVWGLNTWRNEGNHHVQHMAEFPSDSRGKQTVLRSRTCHRNAWDSGCCEPLPRSAHARLWLDRYRHWPAWQPWHFLTRSSPRWSTAGRGNWKESKLFESFKAILEAFLLLLSAVMHQNTQMWVRSFG